MNTRAKGTTSIEANGRCFSFYALFGSGINQGREK